MKVSRLLPLLCLAVTTCGQPAVTTAPSPSARRAAYLDRDVAFIFDSIPILRFNRPFAYAAIRAAVEHCSGLTREGWPTFYVAPQNPLPGMVMAFYSEDTQSIVFALGNEVSASTTAHELLHFLLAPHIPPKIRKDESYPDFIQRVHPDSVFDRLSGKCGPLLYPPTDPNGD